MQEQLEETGKTTTSKDLSEEYQEAIHQIAIFSKKVREL